MGALRARGAAVVATCVCGSGGGSGRHRRYAAPQKKNVRAQRAAGKKKVNSGRPKAVCPCLVL